MSNYNLSKYMNQELELKQKEFKKAVNQLSHELRSPLASLAIVLDSCENHMPEYKLTVLKEIVTKINGMVDHFSCQNDLHEVQDYPEKLVLISLVLKDILSIKKNQYKNFPVKLIGNFAQNCNFAFISVNLIFLKKALAIFIDNAVQSLDAREGVVGIGLELDHENIRIIIQDSGKGLTKQEVDKFINDMIDIYGIDFEIDSEVGIGTKVTLSFPRAKAPDWIVEKIYLNKDDKVVILDDDDSIYKAWEVIFNNKKNNYCLQHFIFNHDAIDFINNYQEKNKILFLADFELLKQELNGIEVIKHVNIQRSILVTSYYADQDLLNIALTDGIKILPKQLIGQVEIIMEDNLKNVG